MTLRDTPPLTIDPARQFGRVCITGTRVPAESVAWSMWAENDPDESSGCHDGAAGTADDYGVTRNEVLLATAWFVHEGHLATIRGKRARKAKWEAWALHAWSVFGGWDKRTRKLCDPDDFQIPKELLR